MLSKLIIFFITAIFFYGLGRTNGIKEEKERVNKVIKKSKSIGEIKTRLRIR